MNKIPSNWHNCATCAHWCGKQIPDSFCAFIEYDPNEKARCMGGGWNLATMAPLNSCSDWEQRF